MKNIKDPSIEEIEEMHRKLGDSRARNIEDVESRFEVPLDDVKEFIRFMPGKKMLDVGCHAGRYAQEFVKAGFDYTGIDISPKFVEIARKRNPHLRFETMSFRKLDFPDHAFDCIWCSCVLQYEPKRTINSVIHELKRVIRGWGLIYIVLPHYEVSEEDFESPEDQPNLYRYQSYYLAQEFVGIIQRNGLKLIGWACRFENGSMYFIAQV